VCATILRNLFLCRDFSKFPYTVNPCRPFFPNISCPFNPLDGIPPLLFQPLLSVPSLLALPTEAGAYLHMVPWRALSLSMGGSNPDSSLACWISCLSRQGKRNFSLFWNTLSKILFLTAGQHEPPLRPESPRNRLIRRNPSFDVPFLRFETRFFFFCPSIEISQPPSFTIF